MRVRASWREGSRNTNDQTVAGCELLRQVDLIAWRVLEQLDVWNGVADFNLQQKISTVESKTLAIRGRTILAVDVLKGLTCFESCIDLLSETDLACCEML